MKPDGDSLTFVKLLVAFQAVKVTETNAQIMHGQFDYSSEKNLCSKQ